MKCTFASNLRVIILQKIKKITTAKKTMVMIYVKDLDVVLSFDNP